MPAAPNLPTPDFTFDPTVTGACIAGVRPYRNGSYRLDTETAAGKFIVHNYGHGGAGITLSWGCAAKVRDIVKQHVAASHDTQAAVLGTGVMGLTAATLLRDLGLNVTIYAERMTADTTSAKAGGQWAVSIVEFQGKEKELAGIIKTAYTTFKSSVGKGFGVSERPNYTCHPIAQSRRRAATSARSHSKADPLARMPFEGPHRPGFGYQTLLIEPPIFLARLQNDLAARGVHRAEEICQQIGGAHIADREGHRQLHRPRRNDAVERSQDGSYQGSLRDAAAQPNLQYLYGQSGYMFPRADHVVIGGTFESGVNNEKPDPTVCQGLVDHVASLFGKAPVKPLPDIHIHHPDNAPIVNPAMVGS